MKSPLMICVVLASIRVLTAMTPDDQPKEKGMIDRIMKFYSWNDPKAPKSVFQGKQFQAKGEFSEKKFAAGEYVGVKKFGSKDFTTKTFEESGKGWFAKLFPSKKLPENFRGNTRDGAKRFEAGIFATKDFDKAKKPDPYAGRNAFATKEASDEIAHGKMEGAGDQHLKEMLLKEGLKKGIYIQGGFKKDLSIDDVKRLLNKPGIPSN